MLLQVALNGARPPGAHPSLPLTPEEQAVSAMESVAAGADAIRAHVRGSDGTLTLPDGTPAPRNGALVAEARRRLGPNSGPEVS